MFSLYTPSPRLLTSFAWFFIVEGCWLGARAREAVNSEEIGSFYAPPSTVHSSDDSRPSKPSAPKVFVETVTDIAYRPEVGMIAFDHEQDNADSCFYRDGGLCLMLRGSGALS